MKTLLDALAALVLIWLALVMMGLGWLAYVRRRLGRAGR